jgi:hypothetical protein
MAKKGLSSEQLLKKPPRKRRGIVSKNKSSNHKQSKNYKKPYRGQGR